MTEWDIQLDSMSAASDISKALISEGGNWVTGTHKFKKTIALIAVFYGVVLQTG